MVTGDAEENRGGDGSVARSAAVVKPSRSNPARPTRVRNKKEK